MIECTLEAIGRRITNDNHEHCTSYPLFEVQQRKRVYGMDPQYTDDIVWHDGEVEADAEEHARLEACHDADGSDHHDAWTRTAYVDEWNTVTWFLTKAAAEEFVADNAHRLCDPRIYVSSAHRNRELIALIDALKEIAKREGL